MRGRQPRSRPVWEWAVTFCWRIRTAKTDREYTQNGNVLLDYLHGASVEYRPVHPDMNGEMEKVAAKFRGEGRRPYTIPRVGGGSNPTGALGYVTCAMELIVQANDIGLKIDHIVHATGSAGTQAVASSLASAACARVCRCLASASAPLAKSRKRTSSNLQPRPATRSGSPAR